MTDNTGGRRGATGEYRLLHKYLHDRYADRVVLTFSEVEDILGFALPAEARVDRDWWGHEAPDEQTPQSAAWVAADRTAKVNLAARNVMFERLPPPTRLTAR